MLLTAIRRFLRRRRPTVATCTHPVDKRRDWGWHGSDFLQVCLQCGLYLKKGHRR